MNILVTRPPIPGMIDSFCSLLAQRGGDITNRNIAQFLEMDEKPASVADQGIADALGLLKSIYASRNRQSSTSKGHLK